MFSRLFGKSAVPDNAKHLLNLLENYPELPVPAKGNSLSLTSDEAQLNLAAFLEAMPDRLAALAGLCRGVDIDWPANFSLDASRDSIAALHIWAGETWPYVARQLPADARALWFAGERTGKCKILSLVGDIALLLGTVIIHERPGISWGIDADMDNLKDRMPSANRIVLLAPWKDEAEAKVPIDAEFITLNRLLNSNDTSERFGNNWLKLVEDASRGGYEGVGVIDPE